MVELKEFKTWDRNITTKSKLFINDSYIFSNTVFRTSLKIPYQVLFKLELIEEKNSFYHYRVLTDEEELLDDLEELFKKRKYKTFNVNDHAIVEGDKSLFTVDLNNNNEYVFFIRKKEFILKTEILPKDYYIIRSHKELGKGTHFLMELFDKFDEDIVYKIIVQKEEDYKTILDKVDEYNAGANLMDVKYVFIAKD